MQLSVFDPLVRHQIHSYVRMKGSMKSVFDSLINDCLGEITIKPFDANKCIFVHIPKNAGTSISQSLFNVNIPSFITLYDYKYLLGRDKFQDYYKFAFIRNPWDKIVSVYTYFKTIQSSERAFRKSRNGLHMC